MFGLFTGMFRGVTSGLMALMGGLLGAVVMWGFMHFAYQGLTIPLPWPLPDIEITDGWVEDATDEATRVARAKCEAEKEASRVAAAQIDQNLDNLAMQEMMLRIHEANERTQIARAERDQFKTELEAEDADEVAAGRPAFNCRVGPRAARGLQRWNLPYPDARPPADQRGDPGP